MHLQAQSFGAAAVAACRHLGVELRELERWYCCGAVFPLADDNVMPLVAPVRTLAGAAKTGDALVTLCSACYNVLKRANKVVAEDAEKREKLNAFIEEDYRGQVRVVHLLEVFRDDLGFAALRKRVARGLAGLRVVPYYGCLLLRPQKEVGLDDPEMPSIFEQFLLALGGEVVRIPYQTECCGAYLTVTAQGAAVEATRRILEAAGRAGAELVAVSCPLCHYNLDSRQAEIEGNHPGYSPIPVVYFTQLLAMALSLGDELCRFDGQQVDPLPVLRRRNLIGVEA